MANTNAPFGFRPVRMKDGSNNIPVNHYTVDATYATKLHTGAPVRLLDDGSVILAATDAGAIIGVFAGVRYTAVDGEQRWRKSWDTPGAGVRDVQAIVYDDENTIFEVQASNAVGALIGAFADHAAGAGSDFTGLSTITLNTAAVSTTAGSKTFRIRGIIDRPDNEDGAHVKVEVEIAKHQVRLGAGAT